MLALSDADGGTSRCGAVHFRGATVGNGAVGEVAGTARIDLQAFAAQDVGHAGTAEASRDGCGVEVCGVEVAGTADVDVEHVGGAAYDGRGGTAEVDVDHVGRLQKTSVEIRGTAKFDADFLGREGRQGCEARGTADVDVVDIGVVGQQHGGVMHVADGAGLEPYLEGTVLDTEEELFVQRAVECDGGHCDGVAHRDAEGVAHLQFVVLAGEAVGASQGLSVGLAIVAVDGDLAARKQHGGGHKEDCMFHRRGFLLVI